MNAGALLSILMTTGALAAAPATNAQAPASPPAPPPPMACDAGFQAVVGQIKTIPAIRRSVLPVSTRLETWFDDANTTIYFVTVDGVPAHPSVIRVKMTLADEQIYTQPSGCTYGRPDQVERLQTQVDDVIKRLVQESPE